MANKKLDALLDERANDEKPVIQRGAGMRLSTATQATPNDVDADISREITTSLDSDKVGKIASTKSKPERKSSGYMLRVDLTKQLKVYALQNDMTLQEALEAAIEEYLMQHSVKV